MPNQDKVKIGLIGAGGIAEVHYQKYMALPNVEVVAISDINEEVIKRRAKEWNVPNAFRDYNEMLSSVRLDGVSVCTPHKYHAPAAIAALNAGVNVLVEKPMASSAEEAYAMYKAAEKNGKVLMVGFQSRYNPELQAAKKFIESGFLGKAYYAEAAEGARRRGIPGWGPNESPTFISKSAAGGGVTLDIGVYALDDVLYLLNHPVPVSVSALTADYIGRDQSASEVAGIWGWDPKKFDVEDFSAAFIRFEDDLAMVYKQAWAMHAESLGNPILLGTKGGLTLSPLTLYTDMNGYMVNISPQHLPRVDTFMQKVADFVQTIEGKKANPIDPKGIVIMHYIIDAIYSSAQSKREVAVSLPKDLT
ncbi:Gfo/Idh/MocA family oxidoreductase [Tardisphaera miroshnichenkoae]